MILTFRDVDEKLVKANKGLLFPSLLSLFSIWELYLRAWRWFTPGVDRKVKVCRMTGEIRDTDADAHLGPLGH